MTHQSLREWIADQDRYARRRHEEFHRAAGAVAEAFSAVPWVRAVRLFGSVARRLETRITRRGWEMLHDCKDVDLAVWIDRLDSLAALNKARGQALRHLFADAGIGVAHHQVDVFLFEPETDRYLGRLCTFSSCPKGKLDCQAPGCGREPLLRQHEGFEIYPDALAPDRTQLLYQRYASGVLP